MRLQYLLASTVLGAVLLVSSPSIDARPALQLDQVRAQQTEIRQGVQSRTGRYRNLDENKRNQLLEKQDFVLRTIEGKQSPNELSDEAQMEVFNALEWIEAAINNNDGERMVCRMLRPTGSNMPTRVCKTEEQMRLEREHARKKREESHGI
jgi:hypothetical protein